MDRTKEFKKIVETCSVYQTKPEKLKRNTFISIETEINCLKNKLSDCQNLVYEKHKIENNLSRLESKVSSYKYFERDDYISYQDEMVGKIKNTIEKRKVQNFMISIQKCKNKLKEITKTRESTGLDVEIEEVSNRQVDGLFLEQVLEEKVVSKQRTDEIQRRERIQSQISELGQLICDISLHVQSQGENITRIDEFVEESASFLQKNVYEIKRLERYVKGNRSAMIKFFGIWIIIFLLFLIFRFMFK